jgi:hypothetical protein
VDRRRRRKRIAEESLRGSIVSSQTKRGRRKKEGAERGEREEMVEVEPEKR